VKLWKVSFEYPEHGYIPNIVAETAEAARVGAEMMLKNQGLVINEITTIEEMSGEKETLN
jgi:hypothetical protein